MSDTSNPAARRPEAPGPPIAELDPAEEAALEATLDKTKLVVDAALALKAERPVVLDMSEVSAFADTFVIVTGRSDRHARSIADAIIHALKESGDEPLGIEGLEEGRWVLIDANDAIVHVFDASTRDEFDLERLWSDAPRLDLVEDLEVEGLGPEDDTEMRQP